MLGNEKERETNKHLTLWKRKLTKNWNINL